MRTKIKIKMNDQQKPDQCICASQMRNRIKLLDKFYFRITIKIFNK